MTREHARSTIQSAAPDVSRLAQANRVTWISILVNIVLTLMQLIVGWWAHSQSLIADAMHTLSDIVADGFVLFANKKGAEAADEAHPYGHGRIETVASLALGVLLAVTGLGILVTAVDRLQHLGNLPPVGVAAMIAATVTLAGKESLFRYMLAVAERLRSPMLVANAWHARADALSSLVVAAGIGGALAGFSFADAAAAVVVGAMICKTGVQFGWEALSELMDKGLDPEEVEALRNTLEATPGVLDAHEIRTRRMGHKVLVDVHVQVSPRISVSEGHLVAETARSRVLKDHPEVLDVLVHVDPENDMDPTTHFIKAPSRAALEAHLRALLGEEVEFAAPPLFHYLGQRVEADVFVQPALMHSNERLNALRQRVREVLAADPWLSNVHLNVRIAP